MDEYTIIPCCGCGMCCRQALCVTGRVVHGDEAPEPCPSLTWDGHRYWCGVVLGLEGEARERLIQEMAIGAGCGSSAFNTWRKVVQSLDGPVNESVFIEEFHRRVKNGNH